MKNTDMYPPVSNADRLKIIGIPTRDVSDLRLARARGLSIYNLLRQLAYQLEGNAAVLVLEQLYDCAEKYLKGKDKRWEGLAPVFARIFDADITIYRIVLDPKTQKARELDIRCCSNMRIMDEYVDKKLYEHHAIFENDLAPLEPHRRTDDMDEAAFRKMGPVGDFWISKNVFYHMTVPAVMSDGSFFGVFLWRTRDQGDFSDLEKQRMALFTRHLVVLAGPVERAFAGVSDDLINFGRRYGLTKTEMEILGAVIAGKSLKEIAADTKRSYGTVRWHVQNVLEKCHVPDQKSLLREFYHLIQR